MLDWNIFKKIRKSFTYRCDEGETQGGHKALPEQMTSLEGWPVNDGHSQKKILRLILMANFIAQQVADHYDS